MICFVEVFRPGFSSPKDFRGEIFCDYTWPDKKENMWHSRLGCVDLKRIGIYSFVLFEYQIVGNKMARVHKKVIAKSSPGVYRRNLPHIQNSARPIYITFCTRNRWVLPEQVRSLVLKHCLHDHGKKYWMHAAIVMPDHVHMILSVHCDAAGLPFGLPEILHAIKSTSAHSINKALGRNGAVWQDESFDHVLRSDEQLSSKSDYIWNNPVRVKLVARPDQWRWFWAEWMDAKEENGSLKLDRI